jgi:hypothetical protein
VNLLVCSGSGTLYRPVSNVKVDLLCLWEDATTCIIVLTSLTVSN